MIDEEVLNLIKSHILRNKEKLSVVAIDGPSAAGKTTLAKRLSEDLDIQVVHTDDFYRPRDKDGKLQISEFDGNFDIERFKNEVVANIGGNTPFEVGAFDCKQGRVVKKLCYQPSNCFVIEGSYSHNEKLGNYATLKVFCDVSPKEQEERIKSREGEDGFNRFNSLWIPAVNRYFAHYKVKEKSDIIINNTEGSNGHI